MHKPSDPIAVFDSGMGGISVLRALRRLLPQEHFLYYGDSANAPYGSRETNEIRALSIAAYNHLAQYHPKATVIACNTATAAAAQVLRREHPDEIIVGIEPALLPAVRQFPRGNIVVMATEATLRERKFAALMEKCKGECRIVPLPCPELVEFVERGEIDSAGLYDYLRKQLQSTHLETMDAIVLGCTHFPFVRAALAQVAPNTVLLDGGEGTAMHTRELLHQARLLREKGTGDVLLMNSCQNAETMARMHWLLEEKSFDTDEN